MFVLFVYYAFVLIRICLMMWYLLCLFYISFTFYFTLYSIEKGVISKPLVFEVISPTHMMIHAQHSIAPCTYEIRLPVMQSFLLKLSHKNNLHLEFLEGDRSHFEKHHSYRRDPTGPGKCDRQRIWLWLQVGMLM